MTKPPHRAPHAHGPVHRRPHRRPHRLPRGPEAVLRGHRHGRQPGERVAQGNGFPAGARREPPDLAEPHRQRQRNRRPRAAHPAHDIDVLRVRGQPPDPAALRHRPHHPAGRTRLGRALRPFRAPGRRPADLRSGHRAGPELLRHGGAPLHPSGASARELDAWARRKGPDGLDRYWHRKNRRSIDGLAAPIPATAPTESSRTAEGPQPQA